VGFKLDFYRGLDSFNYTNDVIGQNALFLWMKIGREAQHVFHNPNRVPNRFL